jgi:hypothetical protein
VANTLQPSQEEAKKKAGGSSGRGDKHLSLNLTTAVTVSQPFIPLGSLLLGGLITLAGVLLAQKMHNQREERNRNYELKKETYNEVLSTIVELNHAISELPDTKRYNNALDRFYLMHYRLAICGATEVQNLVYDRFNDNKKMGETLTVNDKLISAIKNDLMNETEKQKAINAKRWWQFWK